MTEIIGSTKKALRAPAKTGEVRYSSLDVKRAALHTGWKPFTSLHEESYPRVGGTARRMTKVQRRRKS